MMIGTQLLVSKCSWDTFPILMPSEAIGHQLWGPLAIRTWKPSLNKMKHWTYKVLCFVSLGWKCSSVGECLPDGHKALGLNPSNP